MHRLGRLLAVLTLVGAVLPTVTADHGSGALAPVDGDLRDGTAGHRSAIVSFHAPPGDAVLDALDRIATIHHVYTLIDAAHVTLPVGRLDDAAALDPVSRIDEDEPLELHLDTSRPAVQVGPTVWDAGFRGRGTTIAVVDTGITSTHPTVQGRVARCVTFGGPGGPTEADACTDADGHGTHVAGIAAGNGGSSILTNPSDRRYAGVAVSADLVSLDISQDFTTSTAIRAFEWVHDNHEQYGITVVQNSWGRKEVGQAYDPGDPAIRASNALVSDDDQVVVFSGGNEGPEASSLTMEAQNPNVLTVAATDGSGNVAEFSGRGPVLLENGSQASWTKPDVSAPGVGIKSAATGERKDSSSFYTGLSGTSQAAPHVAGIAALIRANAPDIPAAAVVEAIERSARDIGPDGPDPTTGLGTVRATRAIDIAMAEGASLASRNETYTATGRLAVGTGNGGLLPDDSGAESERANGSFPVKPQAERLEFRFTWASGQDPLPRPDLRVRLTDPGGRELLVPAENGQAQRSLTAPLDGRWNWEATAASSTQAGVAAYELNATVQLSSQQTPLSDTQAEGGFFDQGPTQQAERLYQDAVNTYGVGPVLGVLAVAIVVTLGLAARQTRRG